MKGVYGPRHCSREFYNEMSSLIYFMYTTHQKKISRGQQFLLSYIASTLDYAERDPAFAHTLVGTIMSQDWRSSNSVYDAQSSQYKLPLNQEDAVSIARWIFQSLHTHPEYKTASSTLAHWAQNYESPKDLVLGIVGLAIIGPTLGIISSKKKKKRKSQLVIEESFFTSLDKEELAALSTQCSQSVIAQETRLAGGNVYNLHPDSAAWCLEEAITQIYTDSQINLKSLFTTVTDENLSHHSRRDAQGNIQLLVISPSVNDSFIDESDAEKI